MLLIPNWGGGVVLKRRSLTKEKKSRPLRTALGKMRGFLRTHPKPFTLSHFLKENPPPETIGRTRQMGVQPANPLLLLGEENFAANKFQNSHRKYLVGIPSDKICPPRFILGEIPPVGPRTL